MNRSFRIGGSVIGSLRVLQDSTRKEGKKGARESLLVEGSSILGKGVVL